MTYDTVPVNQELCERVMCGALSREDLGKLLNVDPVTAGFSCSYAGYVGVHTPCEDVCKPYLGEYNARMSQLGMQPLSCAPPKQPPLLELPTEEKQGSELIVSGTHDVPIPYYTPAMLNVPALQCRCGFRSWVAEHPVAAVVGLGLVFAILKGGKL